jgi:RNA-directed DNA polymerase
MLLASDTGCVLALVKAFLKAGILGEDQVLRDATTGTPQGGILSPLLANVALSVLDEHFMGEWESWGGQYGRSRRRGKGLANYRLVRYADDFVVLLTGTASTSKRCGLRWQRCSLRWAFACRRRRR